MGGYGIVWNDDLDLSCDELWDKVVQVDTPFDGLMSFADATQHSRPAFRTHYPL